MFHKKTITRCGEKSVDKFRDYVGSHTFPKSVEVIGVLYHKCVWERNKTAPTLLYFSGKKLEFFRIYILQKFSAKAGKKKKV